jgi:accessory colonization factor AcfC
MRALSLLLLLPFPALAAERDPVLRAYGPGGLIAPFQECGRLFAQQKGVSVRVDGGPEQRWRELAESTP